MVQVRTHRSNSGVAASSRRTASTSPERLMVSALSVDSTGDAHLSTCGCVFTGCAPQPSSPIGFESRCSASDGMSEEMSHSGCESDTVSEQYELTSEWVRYMREDAVLSLDDQLAALTKYLQLSRSDAVRRDNVRLLVQRAICRCWPEATVKVCGTQSYDLALPCETIDLVAECCDLFSEGLTALTDGLHQEGFTIMKVGLAAHTVLVESSNGVKAKVVFTAAAKSSQRSDSRALKSKLRSLPQAVTAGVAARVLLGQCGLCGDAEELLSHHQVMKAAAACAAEQTPAAVLLSLLYRCRDEGAAACGQAGAAAASDGMLRAVCGHYIAQIGKGGLRTAVAFRAGMPFWGRQP
eukprot:TRINITY_DN743_c3_g1_i3.p1 TRINITY_DN743_c3_g1~~TRINITY_DN743_c3_g1_i3.p1  ORF type:complete len:352 (+),score=108.53 TRINITY_DN743_c3_g1_i3:195-1250(+)